jgi:hypothetical protein
VFRSRFSRVLPCKQPFEAQLSGTIAKDGVECEVSQFCVSGGTRN